MWQQEKQDSGIVRLALLLALTTSPVATNLLVSTPSWAQSGTETPSFSLPSTVASGTTVKIDGYSGFAAFNQNLQQGFEQKFSGTKVELASNGTEAALKALLDGQIDLAAIGRGLTPEEKAQGLEQVRLHREKIAIIVGADNPFQGSLTDRQFARIFRGRITNWSQLGEARARIRVIDRPDNSGTREALSNYPVFRATKFATGSTATQVAEDNTAEIVKQLGKDGISYARANQVSKLPGVRILKLHDTLPDDPKYPFSQPFVYVYKKNPNPGVAAFLGFALAPQGQQAVEAARIAEAEAIAKGESSALLTATNPSNTATMTPEATTAPTTASTTTATTSPTAEVTPGATTSPVQITTPAPTTSPFLESNNTSTVTNINQPSVVAPPGNPQMDGRSLLWWLLLPIGAIGASLLWFLRRPSANGEESTTSDLEPSNDAVAVSTPPHEDSQLTMGNANTNQNTEVKDKIGAAPLPLPPELEQSPWDMEAPAAIVNTSYPQIVDTPKPENVTNEAAELPNSVEVVSSEQNLEAEVTATPETETSIWAMTEEPQSMGEAELSTTAVTDSDIQDADRELTGDVTPDTTLTQSEVTGDLWDEPTATSASVNQPDVTPADFDAIFAEDEPTATPDVAPEVERELADDFSTELPQLDINSIDAIFTEPDATPESVTPSEAEEDVTTVPPQFAEIPEDALNLVADAAEAAENENLDVKEYILPTNLENLAGGAAAIGVGIGAAASIHGDQSTPQPETTGESLPTMNAVSANVPDSEEESSIVLKPRSPEWAYVSWYISASDRESIHSQGISQLALRLYDVTDIDLSYQEPPLVHQYECAITTTDNYVSIPVSDHNYLAEIGYITTGDRWVKIACSEVVRVFSRPYTDHLVADNLVVDTESQISFTSRTPKWAYISWEISPMRQQMLRETGISQLALRLYDVTNIDLSYQTPQLIQQYECEEVICDRYIAIPHSDRDYMVEIGYFANGESWVMIARSPNVHVFSPPYGDFWFVADAELIIHGATEPGATVNIAGKPITLKPDGTFHLRVPFSKDLIEYLITVSAANGKQTTSVHKKFSQENLES